MEEDLGKEILTPKRVRQCVRELAAASLVESLIPGLALAVCLMFTIKAAPNPIAIMFGAMAAYFGYYFIILLANCIAAFVISMCRLTVVKSVRVKPCGEKEMYRQPRTLTGGRNETGYIIHFHGYGRRHVPNGMYSGYDDWFSGRTIWESTFAGDEFYLLLDCFERIVYFFPCNNFEYVGEITPNKYEK